MKLGVVIRAHIHIERELISFLRIKIAPAEVLETIKLDYSDRVKLALALGFPVSLKAALNYVGTLRNKFAHQLSAKLSKQDADNFEKALSSELKDIIGRSYRGAQAKMRTTKSSPIKQLKPKDRVILYLVALWTSVAVVTAKAKGNGE